MVSGVKPFDGSSLGAVCAQILNAEPMPPSRHNPAVPKALDRIIARCLAKNPKDRFAHCDELASVLYPFARSSPSSAAPKIKKPFWWSKPGGQRDVWITAAACLLLAGSVPVSQSLRARFTVPSAPAFHFSLPEAPPEAFTPTLQTVRGRSGRGGGSRVLAYVGPRASCLQGRHHFLGEQVDRALGLFERQVTERQPAYFVSLAAKARLDSSSSPGRPNILAICTASSRFFS